MSGILGAAFLISLLFLWRQGKGVKTARKEAEDWKAKYWHLFNTKPLSSSLIVSEPQSVHQLQGRNRTELDGQMNITYQLEGWQVNELDGTRDASFTNETGGIRYR